MKKGSQKSQTLFEEAKRYIPGGVNSPVRAFGVVGEYPIFVEQGNGAKVIDADGNEYIDYICSWGPLILGHRPAVVNEAIQNGLRQGTTFGMPTEIEITMAKTICQAIPSVDMVRMVNSGTEATMSALRLARAYTKRSKILKFEGCYHGHADHLLIKAGSGAMTFGIPSSPGVPEAIASETLTAVYNDLDSVRALFAQYPDEIAAVIVEPIAGNMGLVLPKEGFLAGLREVTRAYGALLIFDEVISGFRASYSGAQGVFGVKPDLTCLGKIIGGGLPVGAYGGRRELMEMVSPAGPVYQAGTLSGNPLAMAAGLAMLNELENGAVYKKIATLGQQLAEGLRQTAHDAGVSVCINQFGSLLTIFFTTQTVDSYAAAQSSNTEQFKAFFQSMLQQGMYLPPSQFECLFISAAHTPEDIAETIEASEIAFRAAKEVK